MRTALPAVKKSLNSTVLLYCDTFLLIFITNESESYVKHFNCNAVFFLGGGGYMEQDKAHTPTPRKSWSSVQMSLGNLY